MFTVLKPFTTVNRRFSPETTPMIGPDDLAGCAMPLEHLIGKRFLAAPTPAVVADETAAAPVEPKSKKSA